MRVFSVARLIFILFWLILWLILSPVAFTGDFNRVYEKVSPDGKYKIIAYRVLPTTPISFFQSVFYRDVFLVLYSSNGGYIGQSSPFLFSDMDGIFSDAIFFPGEVEADYSFSVNGINDYVSGYVIPVKNKKWWSCILSLIHY